MNPDRRDPDDLLKAIKKMESKSISGRLKIFLGMAAGVGKTYALLESAAQKQKEGIKVVVASICTHGRKETERLLEPLTVIPEKMISYKEREFSELDLDAILALKPDLAVVDELAHTNVVGARHLKRWEDVMELLDAGIDVYTTLNIQHVESYKDIVESITGIEIRETVPDLVLERASDIELVDITPAELIQRLKEGKVYIGDMSKMALANFFQEDRLTALREISLRFTAELVNRELHEMISILENKKGWGPKERLLVAINHHRYSKQLIRTARRLSLTLHASWMAVYVECGEVLDSEELDSLSKNIELARSLGAEVITTQDPVVSAGIQRVAEQNGITQIIIGKPLKGFLHRFFRSSPVDQLMKVSSNINVHVIRQASLFPKKRGKIKRKFSSEALKPYFKIILWVGAISLVSGLLESYIGYRVIGILFVLSVLLLALFFRRGPVLLAALLFALIWDFFFITPRETLYVSSPEDIAFLVLFFLAALATGILTNRVKVRQELLVKRERSTQAIYEIVREISARGGGQESFESIMKKVGDVLGGRADILVKKMENGLNFQEMSPLVKEEKERAVARWVFENGKEAGWSTSTLPSVQNLYLPLRGFKEVMGVMAFRPSSNRSLGIDESNFLHTVAEQLAGFLERSFAEERMRKSEYFQKVEKIYVRVLNALLDALKRPLEKIQRAIFELKRGEGEGKYPKELVSTLEESEKSLMRLAEDMKASARLSKELTDFQKRPHDVNILVQQCIQKLAKSMKGHSVSVRMDPTLPKISFDFELMGILLTHLLSNAIEYSPPGSAIEIDGSITDGNFELSVSDQGSGIPEDRVEKIFEKFYRIPGTSSTGLGLGLAIVRSIAELHQGRIRAQNRPEGGAKFSLTIPL